jgi:hypothetical protein
MSSRLFQGPYTVAPIVLSIIGLILVSIGGFSCGLLKITVSDAFSSAADYYGFTSFKSYGGCVRVDYDIGAYKAGNAMVILGTIVGVLVVIAAILTTFLTFPRGAFIGMSAASFVTAVFAVVATGVVFAVPDCKYAGYSCSPGPMLGVLIAGLFFWIGAGISCLFMKKYERPDAGAAGGAKEPPLPQQAQEPSIPVVPPQPAEGTASTVVETVVNSDGTKTKTTTVTSVKDGQMIVEKTTETVNP